MSVQINKKVITLCFTSLFAVQTHAAVFGTYEEEGSLFRSSLNAELSSSVAAKFDSKKNSKDAVLYYLEQARVLQVNQQYQESLDIYKKAFELIDQQNNRSKVSVTRMGFKALSMVSNESVVPYLVPPYEQVLAHISQAKNYILLNNAEAAGVEMRVAQQIQREIELAHEKEFAQKKDKQKNADKQIDYSTLDEAFAGLDPIAGRIKNTYQNGYAFYMAANLWEATGDYNNALVDFKKAYELQGDSNVAQDVTRVDKVSSNNAKTVPVIVFIEQGTVPKKIENKLAFPMPNGLINIAFATYEPSTYVPPKSLKIKLGDRQVQQSTLVSDIGALAVKNLKEQTISTVTSQIVRATTKYVVQQQLGQQLGSLGQLAGNLMNVATERADLRAWSTLPSNTQVARFEVSPGKHNLQIMGSQSSSPTLNVEANPNQTVFVYVSDINNKISASVSAVTR
ncbi:MULTISPECIES: COG3014 family protein [unclassified Acinetobacter]|uniref:COG3014 family protein n=1 Tax=unclassified Acinetobacter TaxID=196816 RepID=UPI000A3425C9|nr:MULTISPECIES: hypothetical protein [unclassified Acinetobacter]MDN5512215.1 hypothetical protein [Acinetobacter sp.]MDN5525001.1 hypothetical protein [Acinetobacter sp.]OTG64578.1 hypothetical protein B9T29_00965 [Acinetobacter sp. ANC 3903]